MHRFLMMVVLALACTAVWAENQFKIITLQHRFAQDLLSAVQPLAGADGSVSASGNHLFVDVPAERMAAIEQAVAQLDVASRNYRIRVDRSGSDYAASDHIEASGSVGGNPRIQRGRTSANGVTIELDSRTTTRKTYGSEYLNVLDGARGFIAVGQSVPYTEYWMTIVRRYAHVQQTVQYRDITTGFSVVPRQIGREVELEITPSIASLRNDGTVDFTELTTTVRVVPGEWFDLGGTMQGRDEVSRAILARGRAGEERGSRLQVLIE